MSRKRDTILLSTPSPTTNQF